MAERSLDWNEIVGKVARGKNNIDLGEVKAVGQLNIMTQKGTLIKETHYIPKYLVEDYNGHVVWFNVSEDHLQDFEKEQPPIREDYTKYQRTGMPAEAEAVIPVLEERLQVSKKNVTEEVIIVKEPLIEYKLISVPVMREEIKIIRRPVEAGGESGASAAAVEGDKEIRIILNREEVQITKKPYLFEEVIIRKEKVTDNKTVSQLVTQEKVFEKSRDAETV